MRYGSRDSTRHGSDHQEAVARRLHLLATELAQVRDERADGHGLGGTTPLRETSSPVADPSESEDEGVVLPVPGRHAHRRSAGLALLLARAPVLGPGQLAVVALLVAAGLGLSAWWVLSSQPVAVPAAGDAPALVTPVARPSAAPAGAAQASPDGEVVVDVAGKVRRPGIAVLEAGARVVDAIEAAGGVRGGVDLTSLNLARVLVDGEQILVGVEPVASPAPTGATGAAGAPTAGALVNLNTADATALETLPRVGPVTAQAILGWREQHGGFTAVEELLEVDGIGEATLAQIAPHVTL